MNRSALAFALVITALPFAAAAEVQAESPRNAQWAETVAKERNLYRITPTLYRSSLLTGGDVSLLDALGVKTVVSLRAFHDDRKLLKKSGIKAVSIPINTWAVNDDKVVAALRALRDAEKDGAVLLHCQHGADRTGLVSAMYRIVYQGWSKEQALDELLHGGYGYHSMWTNIPRYIKAVDVDSIRRRLETNV